MRTSFISYTLALASACPAPAIAKGLRNDKTNVLIIMTDEHNLRTLGCYRDLMSKDQAEIWGPGNVVETPHLDALAAKGVIALSAYAYSFLLPDRAVFTQYRRAHKRPGDEARPGNICRSIGQ